MVIILLETCKDKMPEYSVGFNLLSGAATNSQAMFECDCPQGTIVSYAYVMFTPTFFVRYVHICELLIIIYLTNYKKYMTSN